MGGRKFEDILDAIYDAADDPAGIEQLLAKICELVGASANHTLVIDPSSNVAENHLTGANLDSVLEYDRHWRHQDPRFDIAVKHFGSTLSDVAVIDSDEFERSAIYNEHLILADVRYSLFGTFRLSPDRILGTAFFRPKRHDAFDRPEVQTLEAVVPHLVRSMRLRHVVQGLRAELADLRRALDAVVIPMLVLDAKATILCANDSAEDMLLTREGLSSEKGRLTTRDTSERAALEKSIAKAALTAEARRASHDRPHLAPTVKISRSDGTAISVALLPLRPHNEIRARSERTARVLAIVHDPSRIVRVDRALIADLHGLTATEAELAASIAEGKTLAEFAEARGSSEQTARTHLKRILDKTQTSRQADLVRVLLTNVALSGTRSPR